MITYIFQEGKKIFEVETVEDNVNLVREANWFDESYKLIEAYDERLNDLTEDALAMDEPKPVGFYDPDHEPSPYQPDPSDMIDIMPNGYYFGGSV